MFYIVLSFIIATIIALLHKEVKSKRTEKKFTVFVKTFIVSFLVIYIGHTFILSNNCANIINTQEIELGDPDF